MKPQNIQTINKRVTSNMHAAVRGSGICRSGRLQINITKDKAYELRKFIPESAAP